MTTETNTPNDTQLRGILLLAADFAGDLRPIDVDRVMSQAHRQGVLEPFRAYLQNRSLKQSTLHEVRRWQPDGAEPLSRRLYARLPDSGCNAGEEVSRGTSAEYSHAIVAERQDPAGEEEAWVVVGWTCKPDQYMEAEKAFFRQNGCFRSQTVRREGITGRLQAVPAYRKTLAQERADRKAARK
jgi:hypothetical protein